MKSDATVSALIKEGEDLLSHSGIPPARLEAEVLLAKSLAIPRSALLIDDEAAVPPSCIEAYRADLVLRSGRYPLQYITGLQEFYSLDFEVDERVLIPRSETEMMVDEVLRLAGGGSDFERASIIDVGTGSGCIAVAVAVNLERCEVLATDISAPALEVASKNASRHGVGARIRFEQGDGLEPARRLGWSGCVDFVLSNPPYIAAKDLEGLQRELSHEPRVALSPGPSGLEVTVPLVQDAARVLKPGGWLILELSAWRSAEAMGLLDAATWDSLDVKPDLQGLPRLLVARRRP